jgi:hypothetical protein
VYLSPASYAGLHPEPLAVAIDGALEDSCDARALGPRTEEAHFSPDDIDELSELVKRVAAENPPDTSAPVVAFYAPGRCVRCQDGREALIQSILHRVKPQHLEADSVRADAYQAVQNRPSRGYPHHRGSDRQKRSTSQAIGAWGIRDGGATSASSTAATRKAASKGTR